MIEIRAEIEADRGGVWRVNSEAFESDAEAKLVEALHAAGVPSISLVAVEAGEIVGHIMFTEVALAGRKSETKFMGLAPMSVLPEKQNQGIGSKLVKAGLQACQEREIEAVVVLGHPNFYPKFGFTPSVNFGIRSQFDVPDEVFMALELKKGALAGNSGVIEYHAVFNAF